MKIAAAGNTEIPAYLALLAKGLDVSKIPNSAGLDEEWIASDGQRQFIATGLVEVLGLVALVDLRGEDWRASDDEIDEFFAKFDSE